MSCLPGPRPRRPSDVRPSVFGDPFSKWSRISLLLWHSGTTLGEKEGTWYLGTATVVNAKNPSSSTIEYECRPKARNSAVTFVSAVFLQHRLEGSGSHNPAVRLFSFCFLCSFDSMHLLKLFKRSVMTLQVADQSRSLTRQCFETHLACVTFHTFCRYCCQI